jgi:hypothetical protein
MIANLHSITFIAEICPLLLSPVSEQIKQYGANRGWPQQRQEIFHFLFGLVIFGWALTAVGKSKKTSSLLSFHARPFGQLGRLG